MELQFKVDLSGFRKGMDQVQRKQLPFAAAQALTATAGHAGIGWQHEMTQQLDRPTPFTVNSVAVLPARKTNLVATVLIKDVAAQYLEPFVDGGVHFLGAKRGLLTPKNVGVNAYGNLTKRQLANLRAKPDVFIGPVTLRNGQTVNGVWQRGSRGDRRGKGLRSGGYGTKGSHNLKNNKAKGVTGLTTLKLLIRFTDPQPVKQHLDLIGRTDQAIRQHLEPEFAKALAKAMATAN